MSRAFVFPGQGSQAVGMGSDLAKAFTTARDVFQEVDEALKQNLSKLMWEGPEADIVLTENAQPALMAVSMAVARILEKDGGQPLPGLATHVACPRTALAQQCFDRVDDGTAGFGFAEMLQHEAR